MALFLHAAKGSALGSRLCTRFAGAGGDADLFVDLCIKSTLLDRDSNNPFLALVQIGRFVMCSLCSKIVPVFG